MTPYYEDSESGITIYHGDCLDMDLAALAADVVVTDPPYGVRWVMPATVTGHGNRRLKRGGFPPIHGDDQPFDPSPLLALELPTIMFGGNHYASRLPDSGGWLVWDKTGGGRGPSNSFADVEMAWTNMSKTPHIFHHLWKGLTRDSEAGQRVQHPTQKPVALMAWIIEKWTQPGDLILDPYTGSGPVLRAAKDLGRRAIGIEISEAYCEIAAKRLGQGVLDLGGTT